LMLSEKKIPGCSGLWSAIYIFPGGGE